MYILLSLLKFAFFSRPVIYCALLNIYFVFSYFRVFVILYLLRLARAVFSVPL